jgi:hypothetical protein
MAKAIAYFRVTFGQGSEFEECVKSAQEIVRKLKNPVVFRFNRVDVYIVGDDNVDELWDYYTRARRAFFR